VSPLLRATRTSAVPGAPNTRWRSRTSSRARRPGCCGRTRCAIPPRATAGPSCC